MATSAGITLLAQSDVGYTLQVEAGTQQVDPAAAFAPAASVRNRILAAEMVAGLLAALLGWFAAGRFAAPIERLARLFTAVTPPRATREAAARRGALLAISTERTAAAEAPDRTIDDLAWRAA